MSLLNTNIGPERVQVFPQPAGNIPIRGAGISTAAFILSTDKVDAPVQTAVPVNSLEQFVDLFGGPDEVANGAYYAVKGFYGNGGTGSVAYIVNVGAAPTVVDYIGNAANASGLRALDAIDDVGLVMIPGLPLAEAYLAQSELVNYCDIVRTEFGATMSTSFSLAAVPKEITKATQDELLVTAQLVSITGTGPWVLDLQTESTATTAQGNYTVVDFSALAAASVTVAGTTLTEGVEWTAAVSNEDTASSLASAINALSAVTASAVGAVVNITAASPGAAGNLIATLTSDAVNLTVSGATLSGGSDGSVALADVTPGMVVKNQSGSYVGVISAVSDVQDTVTVTPNPSDAFDTGDNVLISLPSAVTYKNSVVANSSAKTHAWYFNSAVVIDESEAADPGSLVVVDPVGHVAGVIARIDAQVTIGGPSHAPAGQQYAGIAGINGLALAISERIDAGPLRLNFINRITSFPGVGPVIFGGYTADSGESATFTSDEQLIQVIRTLQFIKASLEPGLRSYLWENFSPETQGKVVASIESFLRNNSYLFPAGLPESSKFRVVAVEPTTDELNRGLLRVRVQVRPNKAVRFIEVALEFPLPEA